MENSNKQLIAKNSKGEIVKYGYEFINNILIQAYERDLTEIISIPDDNVFPHIDNNQLISLPELPQNLEELMCDNNNIKQLPNLRELKKLTKVWCDICCFEDYMLEMKDTQFIFFT